MKPGRRCPDGGACHHKCDSVGGLGQPAGYCYRVECCGPLSGVFPNDEWPSDAQLKGMPLPEFPQRMGQQMLRLADAHSVVIEMINEFHIDESTKSIEELLQAIETSIANLVISYNSGINKVEVVPNG